MCDREYCHFGDDECTADLHDAKFELSLCDTEGHEWDGRGGCYDCNAEEPDFEPNDANMPGGPGAQTDPDTPGTYPWNSPKELAA